MVNELIEWDKLFAWFKYHYPKQRIFCLVSPDIVDFFSDTAKATDNYEMGGYLLGKYVKKDDRFLFQLYDYIQCRNIADDPYTTYEPSPKCLEEIVYLVGRGRYSIFTIVHTHPSDSFFSIDDLYACYALPGDFSYKTKFWRGALPFEKVPHFLITGGEIGYVITYLNEEHVVIYQDGQRFNTVSVIPPKSLMELYSGEAARYSDEKFVDYVKHIKHTAVQILDIESP